MNAHPITKTIAGLLRDADRAGAPAEVIAELWALRALPLEAQARQLPEWQHVRDEWRAAGLLVCTAH